MTFKFFGIKIEISFLFIALISFVIFCDRTGYILPTIIATVLHEFAHLVSMLLVGCAPLSISFLPSGVIIKKRAVIAQKFEVLISACGPLVNVVLSAFFYKRFPEFAAINLIVAAFNLLPVRGLDGGEILYAILIKFFSEKTSNAIIKIINLLIGIVFLLIGVRIILFGKINPSVIILGIYILLSIIVKF